MRPLTLIAAGLVVVVVDLRTEYFDILPDPIGWGLVALGAWRLSVGGAAWAAGAAALLSASEVAIPYRFVMVNPETGERVAPVPGVDLDLPEQLVFDDVGGWRLGAVAMAAVAAAVALWLLLGALATRARAWGRRSAPTQLGWLRWLTLGVWVVPYLAVLATSAADDGSFDPVWNGPLEYLYLGGAVVVAALVVVLLRESNRAWAVPPPGAGARAPDRRAAQARFDERG